MCEYVGVCVCVCLCAHVVSGHYLQRLKKVGGRKMNIVLPRRCVL